MKKWMFFIFLALALVGGAVWFELKTSNTDEKETSNTRVVSENFPEEIASAEPEASSPETTAPTSSSSMINTDSESFPPPTTEIVNGRTERTIHMGVRQWEWEPRTILAKQGELVRLVIHNADSVNHPLYIPDYGIEADVPPEGAVVEFEASKKGKFMFLCGEYCGEGHAEMQIGYYLVVE